MAFLIAKVLKVKPCFCQRLKAFITNTMMQILHIYFFFVIVTCEIGSYKMITTEYDRSSIISMDASREFKKQVNVTVPDNMQTYPVMISFLKTEIDVSEEISLNTFPNLIT